MTTDCVILTAIPKELDAILFHLRQFRPLTPESALKFTYFETTTPNNLRVVAGVASSMGQLQAAQLTQEAITRFSPSTILLVGIAGGMDREIPLGDVVVSEQIVDYELGKLTAEGFGPRWNVYRPNTRLLTRAKSWQNQTWQKYIRSTPPMQGFRPSLRSGIFLCGNKVIADEETAGALRSVWRKAAAVDMETAGVASVLSTIDSPPAFLSFKGICDYADSRKDDDWQEFAADAAASCAFSFVLDHLQRSDVTVEEIRPQVSFSHLPDRALRETLAVAYSVPELKALCFDLEVDWEELSPAPKSLTIVELVQYVRRRGRYERLIALVDLERHGLLGAFSRPQ